MSKQAGWAAFGIIAVTGLVIAGCAIASSSASPREFIAKTYDCDNDPTKSDRATCDADGKPYWVARDISDDTEPVHDRSVGNSVSYECDSSYRDSDVSDEMCDQVDMPFDEQTVYLQYEDDIVVVTKNGSKSTIDVYDYDDGYRAHSSYFAVFGWSSSNPSSSSGGGFFGGGK